MLSWLLRMGLFKSFSSGSISGFLEHAIYHAYGRSAQALTVASTVTDIRTCFHEAEGCYYTNAVLNSMGVKAMQSLPTAMGGSVLFAVWLRRYSLERLVWRCSYSYRYCIGKMDPGSTGLHK
jgi:hypothetical protein